MANTKKEKFIRDRVDPIFEVEGAWDIFLDMLYRRYIQKLFREIRQALGLTLEQVGERIGVPLQSVGIWETQRWPDYRVTTLQRWARALELDINFDTIENGSVDAER